MWMLRIHRAGGIQIPVRLLRLGHDVQHAIDITLQLLVGISLQQIAGSLNGLIHIGVIERKSPYGKGVARMLRSYEVLIASGFLTLAESQRNGHVTASVQTLFPKASAYMSCGKGHRSNGVSGLILCLQANAQHGTHTSNKHGFHVSLHLFSSIFLFCNIRKILRL